MAEKPWRMIAPFSWLMNPNQPGFQSRPDVSHQLKSLYIETEKVVAIEIDLYMWKFVFSIGHIKSRANSNKAFVPWQNKNLGRIKRKRTLQ
jgi:hypothetical protein